MRKGKRGGEERRSVGDERGGGKEVLYERVEKE